MASGISLVRHRDFLGLGIRDFIPNNGDSNGGGVKWKLRLCSGFFRLVFPRIWGAILGIPGKDYSTWDSILHSPQNEEMPYSCRLRVSGQGFGS